MKKAAKPSGAFPRTSVEKNCRNASPAMTSMGLDAEAGETRMLVDSPGTLVAESILAGCPGEASGAFSLAPQQYYAAVVLSQHVLQYGCRVHCAMSAALQLCLPLAASACRLALGIALRPSVGVG